MLVVVIFIEHVFSVGKTLLAGDHDSNRDAMIAYKKLVNDPELQRWGSLNNVYRRFHSQFSRGKESLHNKINSCSPQIWFDWVMTGA